MFLGRVQVGYEMCCNSARQEGCRQLAKAPLRCFEGDAVSGCSEDAYDLTNTTNFVITLSMLRLLSSKAQECKNLRKTLKPCHVGIHWKALAEYSQMNTHMPGFQFFFMIFASFSIGKINHRPPAA